MRRSLLLLLPLGALLAGTYSFSRAEPASFTGFRQGDLIFQDSGGPQSLAIKAATGSNYTHMGIIEMRKAGPVVIEAIGPVKETRLDTFVARGEGRYAIYRMEGISPQTARKVIASARKDLGKPYDFFFRPGGNAIYCSELAYRAFKAAGTPVGTVEKVGDLKINLSSAASLIDARWQKHPDCKGGTKEACMTKLSKQDIVTPVSIARDKQLTQVFSNF